MASPADPWISALRTSHERLASLVGSFGPEEATQQSYASEWTVADVLSHLGSQAVIFGLVLDAGLEGVDPPGPDRFPAIWEEWNAKSPTEKVADSLEANGKLVERFGGLSDEELGSIHLALFGMELDAVGVARMRLGEHAVHTWDVVVAVDPSATVADDAAALLVDTLGMVAGRAGRPEEEGRAIAVETTSPSRHFVLQTGPDQVALTPAGADQSEAGEASRGHVSLPAEAFIRLVYGRLDPAHTPATAEADGVTLDDLRAIFPGF